MLQGHKFEFINNLNITQLRCMQHEAQNVAKRRTTRSIQRERSEQKQSL